MGAVTTQYVYPMNPPKKNVFRVATYPTGAEYAAWLKDWAEIERKRLRSILAQWYPLSRFMKGNVG